MPLNKETKLNLSSTFHVSIYLNVDFFFCVCMGEMLSLSLPFCVYLGVSVSRVQG